MYLDGSWLGCWFAGLDIAAIERPRLLGAMMDRLSMLRVLPLFRGMWCGWLAHGQPCMAVISDAIYGNGGCTHMIVCPLFVLHLKCYYLL